MDLRGRGVGEWSKKKDGVAMRSTAGHVAAERRLDVISAVAYIVGVGDIWPGSSRLPVFQARLC